MSISVKNESGVNRGPGDIKSVPQRADERRRIRGEAERVAAGLPRHRPLRRPALEVLARPLLACLGMENRYLGFAMVAVSNAFWRDQYAAVPCARRLLLLPHCLRDRKRCRGSYSALGLACQGCGACDTAGLKARAESLGYKVRVMEGTPAVVDIVLKGEADAILGVACLDSLESAFEHIVELGIPHAAAPLLTDGCVDTTAEVDLIRDLIAVRSGPANARTRSFVPLLRSTEALFDPESLREVLASELPVRADADGNPLTGTEAIALEWLCEGGKRFRPFITLAAYSTLAHGESALDPTRDLTGAFPPAVKRVAVAIEALHKASLVHDDIEDEDGYRYGRQTLHRRHGAATALNVGDCLIGLGYQLIASARGTLGAECAADILSGIARAHM